MWEQLLNCTHQFLECGVNGLLFSQVPIVKGNLLTKGRILWSDFSPAVHIGVLLWAEMILLRLPVGDEAGVDITILSFIALLRHRHLADGPPQSGQKQSWDQQVGHHDGWTLFRDGNEETTKPFEFRISSQNYDLMKQFSPAGISVNEKVLLSKKLQHQKNYFSSK